MSAGGRSYNHRAIHDPCSLPATRDTPGDPDSGSGPRKSALTWVFSALRDTNLDPFHNSGSEDICRPAKQLGAPPAQLARPRRALGVDDQTTVRQRPRLSVSSDDWAGEIGPPACQRREAVSAWRAQSGKQGVETFAQRTWQGWLSIGTRQRSPAHTVIVAERPLDGTHFTRFHSQDLLRCDAGRDGRRGRED